jgi:hypothetical protein
MTKNELKLRENLLKLSNNKQDWDKAKFEWKFLTISKDKASCLCGKNPIYKLCHMFNKINHNHAIIGTTCVAKYLHIPADIIYDDILIKLKEGLNYLVSIETIEFGFDLRLLSEWERDFYLNITKAWKKKMTDKQKEVIIKLNGKLLAGVEKELALIKEGKI